MLEPLAKFVEQQVRRYSLRLGAAVGVAPVEQSAAAQSAAVGRSLFEAVPLPQAALGVRLSAGH